VPEDYVQLAPDGAGTKVRTRSRVVGANTVHEQPIILGTEQVPINRGWFSTLRVPLPQTAATITGGTIIPVCSIWNGIASGGNLLSIRRLVAEMDTTVTQMASAPILRWQRMSAQAGTPGGTVITPVQQYTAEPVINSLVSVRANHAGDGAAGTLALGTLGALFVWQQTMVRFGTAAAANTPTGFEQLGEYNLLPNDPHLMQADPLILRPQEGIGITAYFPSITSSTTPAVGMWTVMIKGALAEMTYP
jgi:hypothetical protein